MKEIELSLFSPRWGHPDTYRVKLTREDMRISLKNGIKAATATYVEGCDPEWSGPSLQWIMNNDKIYPPEVTPRLFQHVWLEWRNGRLSDDQVETELKAVADWINVGTETKPNSKFWRLYF